MIYDVPDEGDVTEDAEQPGQFVTMDALRKRQIKTLTDIVFWSGSRSLQDKLERYRIEYERVHNESVDLNRHYTSMLPVDAQVWLISNEPKRWYDGLPPYVKAYISEAMRAVAQSGELDNLSDGVLKLFFQISAKDGGKSLR